MNNQANKKGVALLLLVVIIATAGLSLALLAAWSGLFSLEQSFYRSGAQKALYLADGCTNLAWENLRQDYDYPGESLLIGPGSCIITVNAVGKKRQIEVVSEVREFHKKIYSQITKDGGKLVVEEYAEEPL